ncbi:MAG TPA: hypothetical protein VN541_01285 [Tepidisphaeraceae bacterium]|nr:hypothetical protein [Tepidisphaeraceae bacterium]
MPPIASPIQLPPEVLRFCEAHHILPQLETAMRIASEVFTLVRRLDVALEEDPETGEEAVVIDVTLAATVDQSLAQKNTYTRRWVESATPDLRERIRLLINLI